MNFTMLKMILALSILSLTVIAGILPLRLLKKHNLLLDYGNTFSSGVFLGAALLDLLPEAMKQFAKLSPNVTYPIVSLICLSVFIILFIMEQSVMIYDKQHKSANNLIAPCLLVLVLTVHSLIEGAAIGINTNFASMSVIFFAVIAHKGSESFALTANLHRYTFHHNTIIKIILAFSFMTPLGILGSTIAQHLLHDGSQRIVEPILTAVAAGTFLYLGSIHIMEKEKPFTKFGEIISLCAGCTMMGVVAIWL